VGGYESSYGGPVTPPWFARPKAVTAAVSWMGCGAWPGSISARLEGSKRLEVSASYFGVEGERTLAKGPDQRSLAPLEMGEALVDPQFLG
jgi:hypothetical protein